MAKPLSVGLQVLGWLIGLYFAVTGQISEILGYIILAAMVVVSGWTIWHGVKDIRLAYKERKQLRTDLKEAEQDRESLGTKLRETERERDELRQENEELIAEPENRPNLPDTLEEWLNTVPLTTVANRTYRNERIELDGFLYDRCVFEDCTFSFKGTKPFRIVESSEVKGTVNIDARGPQLQALLIFMKQLGALHPNSKWYDFYDGRFVD